MNYKIDGITLYTCDKYGNTFRKIADKVVFASYNESRKMFVVVGLDGVVRTTDDYGNPVRKICENAVEARFMDNKNLIVRTNRGGTEQRDEYGFLVRTL